MMLFVFRSVNPFLVTITSVRCLFVFSLIPEGKLTLSPIFYLSNVCITNPDGTEHIGQVAGPGIHSSSQNFIIIIN
jgi:hypothetical protein